MAVLPAMCPNEVVQLKRSREPGEVSAPLQLQHLLKYPCRPRKGIPPNIMGREAQLLKKELTSIQVGIAQIVPAAQT